MAVTTSVPPDVDRLLASVVLASLSPSATVGVAGPSPGPERPLPGQAAALVAAAVSNRVTGLVWDAVQHERLVLPENERDRLERHHRRALTVCLRLDDHLLGIGDALVERGVEFLVLKGSAVAHLDYREPELRIFGDVDLLVRPEQFDEAVAAITSTGVERRFPEIRPRFDQRFAKGVEFYSDSVPAVDLHRTFVMGPFGLRLSIDDLWATSDTFHLAGVPFGALDRDVRFLHACYHAALGDASPRWAQLADIVQLLRRPGDPVDVGRCRELAAAWGGESVVARAVRLAWDRFGLAEDDLSAWAAAYRPDATERRALRTYLDPSMGYAARCAAAIGAIPTWRDRAAFAWSLALPSADYGAGQHGGHLRRWRHAGGQLVRLAVPGRRRH